MAELKRKTSETLFGKDDMIALLLPPKSVKNEYEEQKPAEYVFKCMDGDIHVPEYGISRTDFYYQDQITYSDTYEELQVYASYYADKRLDLITQDAMV